MRLDGDGDHAWIEEDVDAEVQFHLARKVEQLIAAGMGEDDARQEALRRFGDPERIKGQLTTLLRKRAVRRHRSQALDRILGDLKHGARSLGQNRGASVVAIISLGVGIGLNIAIFSAVNAVLLRPLPYREPEQLVEIGQTVTRYGNGVTPTGVAPANFFDWQASNHSFEAMAIYDRINFPRTIVTPDGAAVVRNGYGVSANFFQVLGVEPALGRTFVPEEDRPDAAVVVMSNSLWRRDFTGDPDVLGRTLVVDGESHTIIAVMGPAFQFYMPPAMSSADTPEIELFFPYAFGHTSPMDRRSFGNSVIARMKPGVSFAAAQAEMNTIAEQLAEAYPAENRDSGVYLAPLHVESSATRSSLWLAWAAMAILFLICCVNVSGLILVRTEARRHEMATRLAIGASRGRLLRQLLTETLLLGIAGGAIGLTFAWTGSKAIAWVLPGAEQMRRLETATIDVRILLFAVLASLVASLLCGFVPAWRGSRTHQLISIHESRRTTSDSRAGTRLRSGLVAVQVALSMVLLAGAGLMVRSVWNLHHLELGFEPDRALTFRMYLPARPPYATEIDVQEMEPVPSPGDKYWAITPRSVDFPERTTARLLRVPGVSSVVVSSGAPMVRSVAGGFRIAGRPVPSTPEEQREMSGWVWYVTPGYFDTFQIPLRQGRDFSERDTPTSTRVAVANEFMAKRWWPDQASIVGEQISIGDPPQSYEIVGVAGDVRAWARRETGPQLYVPMSQNVQSSYADRLMAMRLMLHVVIRTSTDPQSVAADVRSAMRDVESDVPLEQIQSMAEAVGRQFRPWRSALLLLGIAGGLSLLSAALGTYAVISYVTGRRTNEIGLRMALGADRQDVTWLVIRSGLVSILIGALTGTAAALGLTRFLASQLFGVKPLDPAAFLGAMAALIAAAMAASYLPARRACGIDPASALREE